ncbi:MAG: hypothetical protein MUF38_14465 [Anaerolineae bacterium]|jgi:hypothetical protein|nr:hypothetical protein [Anaerolineae bacterium]
MHRIIALLMLVGVLVAPAAAQSDRQTTNLTDLAQLVPAEAVGFIALRTDGAYVAQIGEIWEQHNVLVGQPQGSFEEVLEDSSVGEVLAETASWRGDSAIIAFLTSESVTRNVFDSRTNDETRENEAMLGIGITDRAGAEAWLTGEIGAELAPDRSGAFTAYRSVDDESLFLLGDDVLLYALEATRTLDLLLSGDYPNLSDSEVFTGALAGLPGGTAYDFIVYGDAGTVLREANAREFITREITPYREFRARLADFLGHIAIGGVYTNDQDLTIDVGWAYGDPTALTSFGIDPARWVAPPVDTSLYAYIAPGTTLVLHATDLAGTYDLLFDTLTAGYELVKSSPDLVQRTGINPEDPNPVPLLRGGLTVAFAGVTGLNLSADVLSQLDDTDFALTLNARDVGGTLALDAGLLARHTGSADAWVNAVSEAAVLYGYPIFPQEADGGQTFDFSMIIDPAISIEFGEEIAQKPAYDILLGAGDTVVALGTRDMVEYALRAPDGGQPPVAQDLFLPGAQVVGHVDGASLYAAPDSGLAAPFESATFSVIAQPTSMTARLTFSFAPEGGR